MQLKTRQFDRSANVERCADIFIFYQVRWRCHSQQTKREAIVFWIIYTLVIASTNKSKKIFFKWNFDDTINFINKNNEILRKLSQQNIFNQLSQSLQGR